MAPDTIDAFEALALGFAFAGLVASGFEALVGRPAGLALLRTGDRAALASVLLLVPAAPFLIVRTLLSRGAGYRPNPFGVMALTALAGMWSLASGRLVLDLAGLVVGA